MKEIWKDVKGYEGLYQISNTGRIKSLNYRHTGKEKILRPDTTKKGYLRVALCKDGKIKNFRINRLVALHFIPNPNNLPQVNHKDEDKTNNYVENLEWCSIKYNNIYNDRHKKVAEKNTNGKCSIPVVQIDSTTNKVINAYPSAMEAERQGRFNNGSINQCCKNKYKKEGNNIYKGYKWQYLHDYIKGLNPNISKVILMGKEYDF